MIWYEHEVRELEQVLARRPPTAQGIAFYGSSSIRFWHSLADDFPDEAVVNLGFGGSTLAACAHFFDRLVPPCRPRSVVLYAGDNDIGDGRTPADVLAAFQQLHTRLRDLLPNCRLAVLAIKPSPARWSLQGRIEQANGLLAHTVTQLPLTAYVDTHSAMLGTDGRPRTELYAGDGLHLSAAGYRLWADLVRRHDWIFTPTSS